MKTKELLLGFLAGVIAGCLGFSYLHGERYSIQRLNDNLIVKMDNRTGAAWMSFHTGPLWVRIPDSN